MKERNHFAKIQKESETNTYIDSSLLKMKMMTRTQEIETQPTSTLFYFKSLIKKAFISHNSFTAQEIVLLPTGL